MTPISYCAPCSFSTHRTLILWHGIRPYVLENNSSSLRTAPNRVSLQGRSPASIPLQTLSPVWIEIYATLIAYSFRCPRLSDTQRSSWSFHWRLSNGPCRNRRRLTTHPFNDEIIKTFWLPLWPALALACLRFHLDIQYRPNWVLSKYHQNHRHHLSNYTEFEYAVDDRPTLLQGRGRPARLIVDARDEGA